MQLLGWIPSQLKNINLQKDGNSWSSGLAPPPPPGTPPVPSANRNHNSGGNNNPSNGGGSDGGSSKSGIGGGGVAGIVISLLVFGGLVAFFIVKRRSRRSSTDVEKLDNQPFASLASHEARSLLSYCGFLGVCNFFDIIVKQVIQTPSTVITKTFEISASVNLRPPPIDRHKSFDEDDFSRKPIVTIVPKKVHTPPVNAISYSIADLQMATDNFSVETLVGEGSIGCVYRAQFDDRKVLAVKKINSSALPNHLSEDFMDILSDVSRLRHPNITELVGYCSEHGQHLLVYEFHKNGSLYDFLHLSDEFSKPLIWNTRVKIALGTARALE
ncbi:protein STRUBBELIG-RECEPTOR FAMILY 6-like [Camellia sinensis]|uniref:protein STRUBBELIG-RECEPTOR FAMILY 6-like n=1 Tax=Camellia sinensis TaxID=4442 RepID=UPI0010355D15|nr:protein STRUBBELIG-RECEPTOR FAMILY 6-like [Camellia sinensis]